MKRRMEPREALEAAITVDGFLCITQEDPQETEPRAIFLEPAQIPTVIEWLNEMLPECEKVFHAKREARRKGSSS